MRNFTSIIKSLLVLLIFSIATTNTINAAAFDVKFLRLHAAQVSEMVVVRWVTDSEINNDYFTVQRTTNGGLEWKDLGIIASNGTTPGAGSYEFLDQEPVTGSVAYRIRQTDFDGSYTYSWKFDIVIIPFMQEEDPVQYSVYPNPSDGDIIIDGTYDIIILTDITGKTIPVRLNNNGYSVQLSPLDKVTGIFFLFLQKGEDTIVEKIKFE